MTNPKVTWTWLLIPAVGLALYLLHAQSMALCSWGPLDPIVRGLTRIADVATLPFKIPGIALFPPVDHHYGTGFHLVRCSFGGVFYGGLVALAALVRARARGVWGATGRDDAEGKIVRPSRRRVLALGTAALASPVAGLGYWSTCVAPRRLVVRRFETVIPGLPAALDGLRIAHLTDTHLGPYISAGHIRRAVEMANGEHPQLVVLTGDYVHRTPAAIEPCADLLGELRGEHGVVAVLGNHDHWEGAQESNAHLERVGIRMLDNDRVFVTPDGLADEELSGISLAICGVGDLWEDEVLPRQSLRQVSADCPRILLSHNPDVAETFPQQAPDCVFQLQLSGHTHGGQVSFPGIGTPLVPSAYRSRYAQGLVEGPGWPVIVSAGVGMAVTPVRWRVRPDVGLIVLRSQRVSSG